MAWFWRGFQSAVFYYVSCAPCANIEYQRKRKKAQQKARAEEEALRDHPPEDSHHPSPFSTNIYWREEMLMGPNHGPRKGGKKNEQKQGSARDLNTGGQGSSTGGDSTDTTFFVSSLNGPETSQEELEEDGWNKKRYQRPDEHLWGQVAMDQATGTLTDGLAGLSKAGSERRDFVFTARNPAVNDMHPPVVSTPPMRKSETRWMLQPPPPAKVMEGKMKTDSMRARSVSGTSYASTQANSVGRQQSGKATPARKMGKQTIDDRGRSISRTSLRLDQRNNDGRKPHERGYSEDSSDDSSIDEPIRRHPRTQESPRKTLAVPHPARRSMKAAASRPQLSTIASASHEIPSTESAKLSHPPAGQTDGAGSPLQTVNSASSLLVLQELTASHSSLNARATTPIKEANIKLARATAREENELAIPASAHFPDPNFRFPQVQPVDGPQERWSMDI
jgi:hypothetical protein